MKTSRLSVLACHAILLAGIAGSRLPVLRNEWQSDTGGWLLISRLMSQGYRPYVDLWDNKPPPIYWLGQLLLEGPRPKVAMYWADVALAYAGALGIAAVLRRLGLSTAEGLAFGGVSACASMPFHFVHSNNVYGAAPFSVGIALLCAAASESRPSRAAAAGWLAGALAGLAAATTALLAAPAVLGLAIVAYPGEGRRARVAAGSGYVLGGLSIAGVILVAAARGGYLRAMFAEAVFGAASYASGAETGAFASPGKVLWEFRSNLAAGATGWLAALAGLLAAGSCFGSLTPARRAVAAFAASWFAASVVQTFLSGYQFQHYHYLVGWSGGLLAGLGWLALRGRGVVVGPAPAVLPPALLAALIGVSLVSNARVASVLVSPDRAAAGRTARLEALLRDRVPPADTLLLVDGYTDVIGSVVRLPNPPGSRHVLASMYEFVPPAEADRRFFAVLGGRLLAEIEAAPPSWLVRASGRRDLLTPVVERLYTQDSTTGDYVLYKRK